MPRDRTDQKLALTRSRILTEAVAFADEQGVEALSMRKLANRLDAGAMSLYAHVDNKDGLIEGMVDLIIEEIELPDPDDEWQQWIREVATSTHRALLAHPWAAEEWSRRLPGPARLRLMEGILATLTAAGLGSTLVYSGYHAITMHIVGFTIQELGYRAAAGEGGLDALASEFLEQLDSARLPHLAEHVRAHVHAPDDGSEFLFVLNLILDGLRRHPVD